MDVCTFASYLTQRHDLGDPSQSAVFERRLHAIWDLREADDATSALQCAIGMVKQLAAWSAHDDVAPSDRQRAWLWFIIAQMRQQKRDFEGALEAIEMCAQFVPATDREARIDAYALYAAIADSANHFAKIRLAWDQVIAAIHSYSKVQEWHIEILAYALTRRAIAGVGLAQPEEALSDISQAEALFRMWLRDHQIRLAGDAALEPHLTLQPTETRCFRGYADCVGMLARLEPKLAPRQLAHMSLLAAMIPWTLGYIKIWHVRGDRAAVKYEAIVCFHLIREAMWAGQALIPHHPWLARASMLIVDIASMGSWLSKHEIIQLRWLDLGRAGLSLAEESWYRQIMAGLGRHHDWLIRLARIEMALMQGVVTKNADNIRDMIRDLEDVIDDVKGSGIATPNARRFISKCRYVQANALWQRGELARTRACFIEALEYAQHGPDRTFLPRVREIQLCLAALDGQK